jgi:hypothetical protein
MTQTSVTFFATAKEQVAWLRQLLADGSNWIVARRTGTAGYTVVAMQDLDRLGYEGPDSSLRIYIGSKAVSGGPVWRKGQREAEIDFVLSQAVQVLPCMQQGDVCYEGTVSIMRPAEYTSAGVRAKLVQHLFSKVLDELRPMVAESARVRVALPGDEPRRARGKFLVTDGALQLYRGGQRFKQFMDSMIEYSVIMNQTA